jgi:hypothetical protein
MLDTTIILTVKLKVEEASNYITHQIHFNKRASPAIVDYEDTEQAST